MSDNKTIFAWVCNDRGEGDELIMALALPELRQPVPLVTTSRALISYMRPFAEAHARGTGKRVKLVRFSNREVLETL